MTGLETNGTGRTHWDVKVYEGNDERETIRNLTHAQKHALMQAFDREGVTATAMEYRSEDGSFQGSETVNSHTNSRDTDQ